MGRSFHSSTSEAPFDIDLSEGPSDAQAVWATASDGVRLRIVFWPKDGARGTVVIYTGRSEFVEKYGRVAQTLTEAGFAVAAIDWRGQGRSDRLIEDARPGHVIGFDEYQLDVDAYLSALDTLGAPGPRFLLAHSLGGAIGLRSLYRGVGFKRSVFSAPMWGIFVAPQLIPVAMTLPWIARQIGQSHRLVPGGSFDSHLLTTSFEENRLTRDLDHYEYMQRQTLADPAFALGGPTLHWFGEAQKEIRALFAERPDDLACKVVIGTEEEIVAPGMVRDMCSVWPSAELVEVADGKHEMMMEVPDIRSRFFEETVAYFKTD